MTELPIELSVDGGAHDFAAIDDALARGEIDEAAWFDRNSAVIVPKYLAGDNPRAQSGHSGDQTRWEAARRPMLAAVDVSGDFLDVGCANGHLMESIHQWASEDGLRLEPYGLDISPELANLARRRLPAWAERIWTGNALNWTAPRRRRFEYVRTGLDYVPSGRRADLVAHLFANVVGRRLVIGVYNEPVSRPKWEAQIVAAGYRVAGRREWLKPDDPRVARRVFWIDRQR